MHGKILGVLCWTPFIWITWYISGLDPQIPLFDQWTLVEFYHAVLVGEAQWADFLAPHNNVHLIVFPRILLTSVALATSLDFKTEIWLSLLLVMATVYFIAKMMDRAGAGNESAVLLARFLCAALLCSPVIYWPWVWSVGFFHFLINLAVVGAAAFLVRGEQGEARARNVLAAMAFCMVASTTRAEGLATWLVFAPLLFSYTRALPHRRKWHLAWFSGALLAGLFFTYSVAAIGPGQPMTPANLGSLAGSLWLSAANILGLIGRPLGAGLQPWVPASWPDPAAFMPVGALMTTAFLGLSWLQLRAPDSPRRDVGLALACVGAFGLVFAGATAFAREGLGAFAPFRPMMYSVTSILVFVAVVNLGALYWGARPGERNSSGRPMLAGGAIVTVMLLLAGYFGAAGEALQKRRETLGSGDCWAVVSHLAERNTCFLGIPGPEVLEMFEQLGFSHTRRDVVKLTETGEAQRGAVDARREPPPGAEDGRIRGWVGGLASQGRPSVFIEADGQLVSRASMAGQADGRWRFSADVHWAGASDEKVRAFVYDRSAQQLVPLRGAPGTSTPD